LECQGVLQGADHLVGTVDLTQGNDLPDMVGGVEAFFLQLACVELGLRSQAQEGLQNGLGASPVALRQQFFNVIGIVNVLPPVVTAQMSGDELFMMIKKQLVRIDFERESLRSVKVRHGVTVGVKD